MPGQRGVSFSKAEILHLLDIIGDVLPIGQMEWDQVTSQHSIKFGNTNRTKETIKRKFQLLYLSKPPTGNPNIPEEIKRAKEIYNDIKEKVDGSSGDPDEENFDGDEDEEELIHDNSSKETCVPTTINTNPANVSTTADAVDINCNFNSTDEDDEAVLAAALADVTAAPQYNRNNKRDSDDAGCENESTTTPRPSKRSTLTVDLFGKSSSSEKMQQLTIKRSHPAAKKNEDSSIDRYFNMILLQRQMDREDRKEEEKRRDERRREKEEEENRRREEEKERREEEKQRLIRLEEKQDKQNIQFQQMMQMMAMSIAANKSTPVAILSGVSPAVQNHQDLEEKSPQEKKSRRKLYHDCNQSTSSKSNDSSKK
jgi:hypothetical protein